MLLFFVVCDSKWGVWQTKRLINWQDNWRMTLYYFIGLHWLPLDPCCNMIFCISELDMKTFGFKEQSAENDPADLDNKVYCQGTLSENVCLSADLLISDFFFYSLIDISHKICTSVGLYCTSCQSQRRNNPRKTLSCAILLSELNGSHIFSYLLPCDVKHSMCNNEIFIQHTPFQLKPLKTKKHKKKKQS